MVEINRNFGFCLFSGLILIGLIAGCRSGRVVPIPTDRPDSGFIIISVDESFRPVVEEQLRVFTGSFPGAHIEARYKPEAECIRDFFRDSTVRMAIITRGLNKNEERYLEDSLGFIPSWNRVASDAVAVVVPKNSRDSMFTLKQLQELLSGSTSDQRRLVFDGLTATSSIRFVTDSILKGKKFDARKVMAVKNSWEVLDYVASDSNSIGFLGYSWIGNPEDTAQLKMLQKVKLAYIRCETCADSPYVKPTQMGIRTRRYPLVKGLFYILKENYSGLGSGFASFMTYERGQLIFRRAFLSPARMNFDVRNVKINEKLKKD